MFISIGTSLCTLAVMYCSLGSVVTLNRKGSLGEARSVGEAR
jgi:hypothetical protein